METTAMNSEDLSRYQKKVESCNSLDDLKDICLEFCVQSGWEYYLFGVVVATSLSSPKIITVTNYPDKWWMFYFKNDLQKCDPVVKYCFEKIAPIRWDKLMEFEQYCTSEAEKFMASAASMGLANGMSIPIRAPSGEVVIFSLATSQTGNIENLFSTCLPHAQTFSYFLFEAYMRLQSMSDTHLEIYLTPREKECLFWACEGKTAWEISKIIDVSERTVIFHITGASKKLGAANRQHAVAKALMLGLIKPLP